MLALLTSRRGGMTPILVARGEEEVEEQDTQPGLGFLGETPHVQDGTAGVAQILRSAGVEMGVVSEIGHKRRIIVIVAGSRLMS